jgi:hypothetical protein
VRSGVMQCEPTAANTVSGRRRSIAVVVARWWIRVVDTCGSLHPLDLGQAGLAHGWPTNKCALSYVNPRHQTTTTLWSWGYEVICKTGRLRVHRRPVR